MTEHTSLDTTFPTALNVAKGIRLAQMGDDTFTPPPPRPEKLLTAQTAQPKSSRCGVSLILLLDESGSITNEDWANQLRSTADALVHPDVLDAIRQAHGISVMVRTFDDSSRTIIPWQLIESPADAARVANILRGPIPQSNGSTEIGGAVIQSFPYFPQSPCRLSHNVVDVSTDGVSNHIMMQAAKENAERIGVTINGLAVGGRTSDARSAYHALKDNLVTPDGFTWLTDWKNYALAIRRKLIEEIASAPFGTKEVNLSPLKPLLPIEPITTPSDGVITPTAFPQSGIQAQGYER